MRIVKDPVERKKELVSVATELFINNGYEKTTVENIINKVGVAKGCFYHYFHSKEEIFEECIASLTRLILDSCLKILSDESKNSKQKLLDYLEYNFQLAAQGSSSNVLESIHSETFKRMHEQIVKDAVKQIMPVFVRIIEEGKINSGFKVNNSEFTAAAILGAFQQIHDLYSQNTGMDRNDQYDLIIDLLERVFQTEFR